MTNHRQVIESLYASAEGATLDLQQFRSCFAPQGYARDVPSLSEFHGEDVRHVAAAMAEAFPDIHREIFSLDVAGDTVVVELAIRGTHLGTLRTPAGELAATGKTIDVPCCDVFRMQNGKVAAFHCYNASQILHQQLA